MIRTADADKQVYVVDDDADFRESLCLLLEAEGYSVRGYGSARAFLAEPVHGGCLVTDLHMQHMDGLMLIAEANRRGLGVTSLVITGSACVAYAVKAMKLGAVDFLQKPFADEELLASVDRALKINGQRRNLAVETRTAKRRLALLTTRERHVLEKIAAGSSNKIVAHELGISPRTVEIHRARIMDKLNAGSLADLVRVSLAADGMEGGASLKRAS